MMAMAPAIMMAAPPSVMAHAVTAPMARLLDHAVFVHPLHPGAGLRHGRRVGDRNEGRASESQGGKKHFSHRESSRIATLTKWGGVEH
jgi:hypothetical protein